MGIIERTYGTAKNAAINELLISSDSHVIEPAGLWQKELPKQFQDRAPDYGGQRPNDAPGGAQDKNKRVAEMAADGVSAEVLYPTHGLKCLSLNDHELEAACCRVYNDWLIDYCSAAPDRLIGISMLSMYDMDAAVKELERCRKAGMRGSVYAAGDLEGARELGFTVITAEELRTLTPQQYGECVSEKVGETPVFMSFDIDFLDPAFAPGTGTPEVGGLATWQAQALLRRLGKVRFVGMDVVEVAPAYDMSEITALAAATMVWEYLALMAVQAMR
jgi:hypothetical protein